MQNEEISLLITEFYNTTNENVRKQHTSLLNSLQEQSDWWKTSILLCNGNSPVIVQFYAAKSLLEIINKKFETIAENPIATNEIQQFYIQKLTHESSTLHHSLLNVLTSSLAVFLMKCLPDIWSNPFSDLTNLWSSQQGLLLRVLAEVGAEFTKISLPLKQRNILRTELLKISKDVAQITNSVLISNESTTDLKNAAVECIDLWLKIPGAQISDFINLFSSVFENVADNVTALSNILSTLKSNEELPNFPNLIQKISKFIAMTIAPLILNELNKFIAGGDWDLSNELNEVIFLICSITEFVQLSINTIVEEAAKKIGLSDQQDSVNVYFILCQFFVQLSTIKGIYPVQECISDLPEQFWLGLREELLYDSSKPYADKKALLCAESIKYFLEVLHSAIEKISYFPEVEKICNKSQLERFESYRISRSDVSVEAIQIAPSETLNLLASCLNDSLDKQDIYREATLFYLQEAADFLNEKHILTILPVIYKTTAPKHWMNIGSQELLRYVKSLMQFLQKIEHLILTSSQASDILAKIIDIILDFLQVPNAGEYCIDALISFVKNRDSILYIVTDSIILKCYEYFKCETNEQKFRLKAIKCMGIALSTKDNAFILNSLDQFLTPRLIQLKNLINGDSIISANEQKNQVLFEISVLEQLVATLESNNKNGNLLDEKDNNSVTTSSPVRLIIDQCIQFFNLVFNGTSIPSLELVTKACDVLKAGLLSLHLFATPLLETYFNYLDVFFYHYPNPACSLAKTLFLTYRNETEISALLFSRLTQWFTQYYNQMNQQADSVIFGERDESFLDLANHVLKKNWLGIESMTKVEGESSSYIECFLHLVCFSASKIIERSCDISLIQESYRILLLITKSYTSSNNLVLHKIVDKVSQTIVSTTFISIQSELSSTYLSLIADILFYFTKAHPDLSRQIIANLPGGDSQISAAMFSGNFSIRNFRLRVSQLHQASLKRLI